MCRKNVSLDFFTGYFNTGDQESEHAETHITLAHVEENGPCSPDHMIQWRINRNYIKNVRINLFSDTNKNVSGYYRNLGSLSAGTRHHGEFSVMGTPSFQPFLKSYWLTPVK